jgi:small subunit ribosomal protein S20
MANTAQARKRARQSVKQNAHNASLRSKLRTSIKAVRKAIESGDKDAAKKVFVSAQSTIDKITDKRLLTKILLLVKSRDCLLRSRQWPKFLGLSGPKLVTVF